MRRKEAPNLIWIAFIFIGVFLASTLALNVTDEFLRGPARAYMLAIWSVSGLGLLLFFLGASEHKELGFGVRSSQAPADLERINRIFQCVEAFLPDRICQEELGDSLEFINNMVKRGVPRLAIYRKVVVCLAWAVMNGASETIGSFFRKISQ